MNILTLSTYPIDVPQHGGQHRLFNIVRLYRELGHSVEVAGVLGSDSYPSTPGFVSYPGLDSLTEHIKNPFLMDDWAIGSLFEKNDIFFGKLDELITSEPDLIHVEQPWLFGFALRYRSKHALRRIKIIYGSQNIEHTLKFDIMKTYTTSSESEEGAKKVLACEVAALQKADGVCCVSGNDLQWSRNHTDVNIVLAQNGVRDMPATVSGINDANIITGHRKTALYCASAHAPNIQGFFETIGAGIGFLSPDERLVVAGGSGHVIESDSRFQKIPGLQRVYVSAGVVSGECLQGLLHTAHVIMLPITHGSGTNLKTAEALWAGKHIIATPIAMRGFEIFAHANGVRIEETPEGFRRAVRSAMAEMPLRLTQADWEARRILLWEQTLQPLLELIRTV